MEVKTFTDEDFRAICRKTDDVFHGTGTPMQKYKAAKRNIDAVHAEGVPDTVCANLENYAYAIYQIALERG
jgi:hypothetical protein